LVSGRGVRQVKSKDFTILDPNNVDLDNIELNWDTNWSYD